MIELVRSGNWQDPEFQGMEEVTIAQNLAAGRGFITPVQPADRIIEQPSAYASPGYPYLLAIILKITGKISPDPILPYRIGFIINAIIGALAVVILAVSARGRFGWVGFGWVGLLTAFWPTLIKGEMRLWDTAFGLLAVAVGVALIISRESRGRSLARWILVGMLCGLLTLFNPITAPFLAMALLIDSLRMDGRRRALSGLMLAGMVWALCLMPWMVRNAVVFHRFIPIRNTFGYTLWVGNLPDVDGTIDKVYSHSPFDNPALREEFWAMGEDAYMQEKQRQALKQIREDPSRFVGNCVQRIRLYWLGNISRPSQIFKITFPMTFGVNLLKAIINSLLLVLAVLGSFLWKGSPAIKWGCWFGILSMSLPYCITHVSPFYRALIDSILITLSAAFAARIFGWKQPCGESGCAKIINKTKSIADN
ncbi:MAG: hypothetical protein A2283_01925 [Lentisphaerae bacterium RIFOXYA12_FULL_48_11]|nr:MAG: hypothetical protein A2283_01925 [Lentisphaerae bacterium RIFOXYA12_FULL_48_11]